MVYSYVEHVYAGAISYYVPFSYIDEKDIAVYINGVKQSDTYYYWVSDFQLNITVPMSLGDIIKIKRETSVTDPIVDYVSGSILDEKSLDLSNTQMLYLNQETRDMITDEYYTKEEVDNKISVIPGTDHAHDNLYYRQSMLYTRTETNEGFAYKVHEHSDIYTDWDATEGSHELRNKPNIYKGTDTPIEGSLIVLTEDGKLPPLNASGLTDITPTAITGISGSGNVNKLLNEQGTFTDLSSITGGEVNVQSDWTETDTGEDSYIKNKPVLGTAALKNVISTVENSSALVESSGIYNKFSEYTDTDSLTTLLEGKSNTGHTHSGVYYTTATIDTMLEDQTHTISDINDMKTDIETDGTFLDNTGHYSVPAGGGSGSGEENVQADWAETTTSSDAYIKNKPIIPQYLDDGITSFELTNDASTNGTYLDNTGNYSTPEGTGGGSGVITDTLDNQIYCNTGRMGTYNTVGSPITSGTLNSGSYYKIIDYQEGDVFSNIGSGIHATGHVFLATGTTPDTWVNGSVLQELEYATYAGNLVTIDVSSGGVSGNYLPLHGTADAALKLSTARTIAIKDATGSTTYGSANFDGSTNIEIDLDNLPTGGSSTFDGLTDVEDLEPSNTVEYLRADGTWGIPPGTGSGEVTFNAIADVEDLEPGNTSEFLDATGHWNTPSVASVNFNSITDVPDLNPVHNDEYLRKDGTWGTPIDTTISGFYDIPDVPSTTPSNQTFLASDLTWQSINITTTLEGLGITATAEEINTVTDGSTAKNTHSHTRTELGFGTAVIKNYQTSVTDSDSYVPTSKAIITYGNSHWASGSSLWTDKGAYYEPNNTSNVKIYDTGYVNVARLYFDKSYIYEDPTARLWVHSSDDSLRWTTLEAGRQDNIQIFKTPYNTWDQAFSNCYTMHGSVYFPRGYYPFESYITLNDADNIIEGEGSASTTLRFNGTNGISCTCGGDKNIIIRGFKILAESSGTGAAIRINKTSVPSGLDTTTIEDIIISHATAYQFRTGIYLTNGALSNLRNITYINSGYNVTSTTGIKLDYNGTQNPTTVNMQNIFIQNCETGIDIDGYEGVIMSHLNIVSVKDGVISYGLGSEFEPQACTLTNSHINATRYCIRLNHVMQSSISNNLLYKFGSGTDTGYGVYMEYSGLNTIIGNVFNNTHPSKALHGISLLSGSHSNNISNNIFNFGAAIINPSYMVLIASGCATNFLSGNTGMDIYNIVDNGTNTRKHNNYSQQHTIN